MVGDGDPKVVNLTGEPVNKLCHAVPFLSLVVGIFQSVEVVELLRSRLTFDRLRSGKAAPTGDVSYLIAHSSKGVREVNNL